MKTQTPGERFKFWIEKTLGSSIVAFAEEVGVEHKTIYNTINNKLQSVIGRNTRTLITNVYPNFPWKWISEGVGVIPGEESAIKAEKKSENYDLLKDMELESLKKEVASLIKEKSSLIEFQKVQSDLINHYKYLYERLMIEYENLSEKLKSIKNV